MNHFNCSDSPEMHLKKNLVQGNEFQAMLDGIDDEDSEEGINSINGKKRRLSIGQVQALERIFEVDNKLETERKIKVAHELGLQPRQVAIWFQNRRARWKTKQLEREYNVLKTNYEALKLNYNKIEQEKEGLVAELKSLKEKHEEEKGKTHYYHHHSIEKGTSYLSPDLNSVYRDHKNYDEVQECINFPESNKGLSDSESSGGMMNEDHNHNLNALPMVVEPSAFSFSSQVYHPTMINPNHQPFVKLEEEHNPVVAEESHNFFSVDQMPYFWYFSDRRN